MFPAGSSWIDAMDMIGYKAQGHYSIVSVGQGFGPQGEAYRGIWVLHLFHVDHLGDLRIERQPANLMDFEFS
jgi:hypothetical protein